MQKVKILVVSDSHGNNENVRRAIDLESPFDVFVHCGDLEGAPSAFVGNGEFDVRIVRGNCDYGKDLPKEWEFKAAFFNVWVTHGDRYDVKYDEDLTRLRKAAKKKHADIVLFGHSHYAEIVEDKESGIILVNPGSIASSIGSGRATYAVLDITEDYEVIPVIKKLAVTR